MADFSQCGAPAGLVVADEGGGEVRRAAATEDYFDASPSAAGWTWGTWNGGSLHARRRPAARWRCSRRAAAPGCARYRSYSRQTLEGRVAFGAGPWQHVGWADHGFGGRWAILSTAAAARPLRPHLRRVGRAPDGAAGRQPGAYHDVRIVWGAAAVDYYVDGALVASHAAALDGPHVRLRLEQLRRRRADARLPARGLLRGRLEPLRLLDQGRRRRRRAGAPLTWSGRCRPAPP